MFTIALQLFSLSLVFVYCVDLLCKRKHRPPRGLKLPPGPPGKPIVGHYMEAFTSILMKKWRAKYGDIVSIHSFGTPIVFVYSDEIAQELFAVKQGATYSDRPLFRMAELLGWDYNIALIPYGTWWRRHIRAFTQFFNSRAVVAFEPVQIKSSRLLLRNLLKTPDDFEEHIKFAISQIILNVTYAIDIKPSGDTFLDKIHLALEGLDPTVLPGQWLVDIFPKLQPVLGWVPGSGFKNHITKYRKVTCDATEVPFSIVKNRKEPDHSFVSISLERLHTLEDSPLPDEEVVISNTAGMAYAAAAGTLISFLLHAIWICLLFPEIQQKLQDELDKVLGDRLPTLADRADLPYFNAFCYEVLRWRPPLPLGVPHAALEDGVLGEFFIPKGSVVILDILQILRDAKYGPKPDEFNPERYFQSSGIPSPIESFGFGRRLCPGRFFAYNTIFLLLAPMLKAFEFVPKKDENGLDIPISKEYIETPLILFPPPFKCSIRPRSSRLNDLISYEDTNA